ncbi:Predicted DNA-binding transcriptional regulator YafY, contains an HTH and WYL domains [Microlunatus soli]|uniref:Predicted DNA-binding transcriptional regulator YafY, contains an HTH and WYL domains n=2 Tax=Microlunatus soli TaxID=630515 RepID=A0A1H1ZHR8_9ACTN|nr:Predicted DNA-binding transcriptional regulator YafY, contains an HTH and WYL domains [Microlunatus soli]
MRMITALLLMQSRGRITAAELAVELEVSVATARRDLEALSTAGVPVYPQPGRGGGWSLVGGARTDLSGLTAAEAHELFLLLGPGSADSELARSAVRKLLRALPGTFQADAEAAAAAVRTDAASWGDLDRERPALVGPLQQAIIDRHKIIIDYRSRTGSPGPRTVAPLGMIDKDGRWYLIATPDDAGGSRTYRVDRIADLTETEEIFQRPQGFDLVANWREVVDRIESERGRVSATVLVDRSRLSAIRSHFGRYFRVVDDRLRAPADHDHGPERVTVTVAAQSVRAVAEQLAGWTAVSEVIGPAPVRHELAAIGEELAARYG